MIEINYPPFIKIKLFAGAATVVFVTSLRSFDAENYVNISCFHGF